jgi:hypothetical protein
MRVWKKLQLSVLCVLMFVLFTVPGSSAQSRFAAPFAQAPEGIPRDLARFRAQQIKDVRYLLKRGSFFQESGRRRVAEPMAVGVLDAGFLEDRPQRLPSDACH